MKWIRLQRLAEAVAAERQYSNCCCNCTERGKTSIVQCSQTGIFDEE